MLTVVRFRWLWLLILLMAFGFQVDRNLTRSPTFRYHTWRITILFLFLAIVIACMPPLGTYIGVREARTDMYSDTTTLPRVLKIVSTDAQQEECSHSLWLLMDSSEIVYFEALDKADKDVLPQTKIRARSSVASIETIR